HLNARILAYAEATGAETLMTICNVCTLNLRQANYQLKIDDALRARVNKNLETVGVPPYSGNVEVRHFLWEIAEGEGYELLKQAAHRGLKGLKIGPFYGCQILRPSKILGFEAEVQAPRGVGGSGAREARGLRCKKSGPAASSCLEGRSPAGSRPRRTI